MNAPLGRTFYDVLREQAEHRPDAVAAIAGDRAATYGELLAKAQAVGAYLRGRGIGRGDRVGVLISNRLEWLELLVGAGAAGATLVPFSTWSTRSELGFLLADSGIRILFAMRQFGDRDYLADLDELCAGLAPGRPVAAFPDLSGIVFLDESGLRSDSEGAGGGPVLPPGVTASAADDGLVLYTSGSSAHPKAVRLGQAGIIENGFNIGERMGLSPRDRVLLPAPLFWSYGSANALPATISHGATIVLQERFEPGAALDLIERHGVTAIYTLPGMTNALLRHPGFSRERTRTLRTGLTIGAPQDFLEAANGLGAAELCNVYGATETYGNCCVTPHHWPLEQRAVCQGPPLPGNTLRFVDPETGAPVGPGEPGLTEIRGYVTPGYSGASQDQNATAFTPDGWYRTGDVARLDEEGSFIFVGRSTEMIKRAGINVSPAEVENVLLLHPAVAQAGVVGVPDRERGELVIAFVVPEPAASVTREELVAHCRSVASKYKVPDRIEIRAALPQTPTGKLQRRELKWDALDLAGPEAGRG